MSNTTTTGTIALSVNTESVTTAAATIADLLIELGYGRASVATARNGEFVPRAARAATPIVAGDRIEIVSPRQGG